MELQRKISNTDSGWLPAILISLAVLGFYCFLASRTTLWDRDEPRFARATVEMIQSHNYLYPTFNGNLRPDKPIMIYWLMSLPVRLFGPTELACRFFGVVGTAITALLIFYIGKKLLSVQAALWSMAILVTTAMMLSMGGIATADAVLMPLLVGLMAVFVHAHKNGMRLFHVSAMGFLAGLAMLTKGPMAILPFAVMAVTLLLTRKSIPELIQCGWKLCVAFAAGCLIFAIWAIPADNATNGEFLRRFIGHHVIGRATSPLEHHGGNFLLYLPYYIPAIIFGFFPWTLHLPGAFSAVIGGRIGGKFCRLLLIAWFAAVFILMTCASTKLPHYILFVWPAMSLAVAGTIVAARENTLSDRDKKWLRGGVWFFSPVAVVLILILIIFPWFLPMASLRVYGLAAGLILAVMAVTAIRFQLADKPQTSAKILLTGLLVFDITVLFGVLPAIEQLKISPAIAQAVRSKTSDDTPVATYKYAEPTLNFYIGRKITPLRTEDTVIAWLRQPNAGVLIVPADVLGGLQQKYGALVLEQIASKKGFNYSKGKIREVLAVARKTENQ